MRSGRAVWPAILCMVAGVAGCAATSVPWRHPDVPREQWGQDYSACRRLAERDSGWREDDTSASALREYDRLQAKKIVAASVSACMIDRGYVPASPR